MSYRQPACQGRVRELGGLPAVLQRCHLDDHNPNIKEWGVLAVRNLCDSVVKVTLLGGGKGAASQMPIQRPRGLGRQAKPQTPGFGHILGALLHTQVRGLPCQPAVHRGDREDAA